MLMVSVLEVTVEICTQNLFSVDIKYKSTENVLPNND